MTEEYFNHKKNDPLDKHIVDVDEETVLMVFFICASRHFACRAEHIREILPLRKINPVPGCPDFILGIINVRGEIESVLSMSSLLDLEKSQWEGNRIMLAEAAGIRSGILVDSVEEISNVPVSEIIHPEIRYEGDLFLAEIMRKGMNAALIDMDALLKKVTSG